MKLTLTTAALALAALGSAQAAEFHAGSSVGNLYINPLSGFNSVSVNNTAGPDYTGSGGQFTGQFYNGQADSFLRFFCIELDVYAAIPGPVGYQRIDNYSNDALRKLYDVAFNASNEALGDFWNGAQTDFTKATNTGLGTALQLAVWEIIYETSGTYSLASGNFTGLSGSAGSAITTQANALLSQVNTYSGSNFQNWTLYSLINEVGTPTGSSTDKQNYVTATYKVPEPGSLALAGFALAALAGVSRRRRA